MKQKCDGDMMDWHSKKSRRILKWKAGVAKRIKKRSNKRIRQRLKKSDD